VILEVEREGVPIRCLLSIAPGVERWFDGWLELADALEAARTGALGSGRVPTDPQAADRPAVVRIS
jgi:hypothetical protein